MPSFLRSRNPLCLVALAALLLSLGCREAPAPSEPDQPLPAPPGFTFRDVNGVEHQPFASPDVKAVTLIFVMGDCPIANGYAPEINRLCQEYETRGVRFYLVQVDPDLTGKEAAEHAREFGYTCPVVLDTRHVLVQRAGATVVPEAVVFGADGERKYRGRIDDRYVDLGKRRSRLTSRDLRDALDAVLAQRDVLQPVTQAIGCFIPPLSSKDPQP